MQFANALALLVSVIGINAVPAANVIKRLDTIPLSFYSGAGCSTDVSVTTVYIPADGSCFPTSPIFSGNTDSALIDQTNLATLPTGCTST
jgi:hypothetical protein